MKASKKAKLFARPSTLLPDEPTEAPIAPIQMMPNRLERGQAPARRGVTSLPEDLDDPDAMPENEEHNQNPEYETLVSLPTEAARSAPEDEDVWGAAFEIDDFRALRRLGLAADLPQAHIPAPPRAPTPQNVPEEDGDLIGMPEEGDVAEHTGVGEQVALPEGFGADIELPCMDSPDDPTPAPNGPDAMPDAVAALAQALARDADASLARPVSTEIRNPSLPPRRTYSEPPKISARIRDQDAGTSTQSLPPRLRPQPQTPTEPTPEPIAAEAEAHVGDEALSTVASAPGAEAFAALLVRHQASSHRPENTPPAVPRRPMRAPATRRAAPLVAPPRARTLTPGRVGAVALTAVVLLAALVVPQLWSARQAAESPTPAPEQASAPTAIPEPVPVAVPEPIPKPVPKPIPKPVPARKGAEATKQPAKKKANTAAAEMGTIRVTSDKKALIIIDGKQRGYAPGLPDIAIKPGAHTVRAVEPSAPDSRTLQVQVISGQPTTAIFTFSKK